VHLVGFTIAIYYDARSYKRRTHNKDTVLRYTGFSLASGTLKTYRILKNEDE